MKDKIIFIVYVCFFAIFYNDYMNRSNKTKKAIIEFNMNIKKEILEINDEREKILNNKKININKKINHLKDLQYKEKEILNSRSYEERDFENSRLITKGILVLLCGTILIVVLFLPLIL